MKLGGPIGRSWLPAVLLAAALGCGGSAAGPGSGPAEDGRFIRDAQGRVLVLHGANVASSAKHTPDRLPDITEDEVHLLAREWGFDFVRYLVIWDRVEHAPGVYDESYLDEIAVRLDWFQAAGLHVLLDMHQDVFSTATCGDGAPEWAVRTDGIPLEPVCRAVWSFNYFQAAVERTFDNFWLFEDGAHGDVQARFVAMWRHVAERFRDHPAVIGYDVLNEPYPGTMFDPVEAALRRTANQGSLSAAFDTDRFAPFYRRVIDAIREVDGERWIFFEPRFGAPGNGSPSFIPRLEDPRPGAPRIGYAPHLYSGLAEALGVYFPWNETVTAWERERAVDVERQGGPLVIGEFGFPWSMVDVERYLTDVLDMADRMLAGWAYWAWDPSGPDGWAFYDRATATPNPNSEHLSRPYPQRIAGEPLDFSFDPATGILDLHYASERGVTAPTEIYLGARRHYPNGYAIETSDAPGTWSSTWDEAREVLSFTHDRGTSEHRIRILPVGG